jgi:hypothetical protein
MDAFFDPDASAALARSFFPDESWREIEPGIFIAQGREPRSNSQQKVLEKELAHARLLTARSYTVHLLPESAGAAGQKHPDALVSGVFMEFKTITGNIRQVEENFRTARRQADSVFLKIDSSLSQEAVLRKLIDRVRKGGYCGGLLIVHFTASAKTFFWDVDALKKSPA